MNRKEAFRIAVDSFVAMVRIGKKQPRWGYRATDADQKTFEKWFEKNPTAGDKFIQSWVEFQVHSYFNQYAKDNELITSTIRLTWIFGSKAQKRWDGSMQETNSHAVAKNLGKQRKKEQPKLGDDAKQAVLIVKTVEEQEKQRYYNEAMGLTNCISSTTLFNHKSSLCAGCKNKTQCRGLLEKYYLPIYKLRGYDK
jgi:hypothetical protein